MKSFYHIMGALQAMGMLASLYTKDLIGLVFWSTFYLGSQVRLLDKENEE